MINKNKYLFIMLNSILLISIFTNILGTYDINKLVSQYAPEIRFHPQEKYFPVDMNHYISQCALQKRTFTNNQESISLEKYPIRPEDITQPPYIPHNYNALKKFDKQSSELFDQALFEAFDQVNNYFISPQHLYPNAPKNNKEFINRVHYGNTPNQRNKVNAPCYYHVQERPDSKGHVIQYIFMYAYQGSLLPENILTKIIPYISDIGIHEGDVEHMDVYIDTQGKIEWIYFSAHGSNPFGEMLDADRVSFNKEGHPIAYAAKFGHALHSRVTGKNGIDAPDIISSTIGAFSNPFSITQKINLAKSTFSSIWNTISPQQKEDIGYTFDTTADKGPVLNAHEWLIDLGTRQSPAVGQEWILFAGRLGGTYDKVNGSIIDHTKKRNFIFNNSPASPAVDNAWWRTSIAKIKIGEFSNIKQGDSLDFTNIIPTRMRKIALYIKANDIQQITLSGLVLGEYSISQENPYIIAQPTFVYKNKVMIKECIDNNYHSSSNAFDLEVWGFED